MPSDNTHPNQQLVNVFVYGTLKRGQPNHEWLTRADEGDAATFVGTGRTVRAYPLVIGTQFNVPFLLDQPGTGHLISGEVYAVDARKLAYLDVLEAYPEFYTRQVHDIELIEAVDESNATGSRVPCWVYMMQNFPQEMLSKPMLHEYWDTEELRYSRGPTELSDRNYLNE